MLRERRPALRNADDAGTTHLRSGQRPGNLPQYRSGRVGFEMQSRQSRRRCRDCCYLGVMSLAMGSPASQAGARAGV